MSDIPAARIALQNLRRLHVIRMNQLRDDAHDVAGEIDQIDAALILLKRRRGHIRKRALGLRATMTPALAARIKRWYTLHPTWDQQRIAERYNVTDARVSEALWGKNK